MKVLLVLCAVLVAAQLSAARTHGFSLNDITDHDKDPDTKRPSLVTNLIDLEKAFTTCNGERCEASCRRNGYDFGVCVSSTRCHCFNLVDNSIGIILE